MTQPNAAALFVQQTDGLVLQEEDLVAREEAGVVRAEQDESF